MSGPAIDGLELDEEKTAVLLDKVMAVIRDDLALDPSVAPTMQQNMTALNVLAGAVAYVLGAVALGNHEMVWRWYCEAVTMNYNALADDDERATLQ